MRKTRTALLIGLLAAILLFAAQALAQEAGQTPAPEGGPQVTGQVQDPDSGMAAEAIEDKPSPAGPDRMTAVSLVHQGEDALGARLAFRLKEIFNTASLFNLTEKDVRKIKVVLTTKEEFPGRPNLGSVYSVTWIFQASENMLTHYLSGDLGFVSPEGVDERAEELAARTEQIATRYAYLFE